MSLSLEEVRKVARLARLRLSPEEELRYLEQLGKVLGYVDQLNEVPTAGVEPLAHPHDALNVLRADSPVPSLPRAAALSVAPQSDGKYFLVPPILDAEQ